ncbi:hypothetical protein BX666DRAFT_189947 [Dichotomocladium elegans]|nr:hypothetical protein BX666DRAFT_189947 [Dichotomocladium elegans]
MKTHAIFVLLFAASRPVFSLPSSSWPNASPNYASASRIENCPLLSPRLQPPSSVHDLRPDDIEIVAAIGDSISAGVAEVNIDTEYLTLESFKEHRGLAFSMGGDAGALTFPNLIQHYKSGVPLIGPSVGVRQLATCPETIFCMSGIQRPELDRLNAAIPAATTLGLEQQAQYLIDRIGKNTEHNNKWKVITVFLGMNDMAVSCKPGFSFLDAARRMSQGLDKLLQNIDHVLIAVVGPLHIENALGVTDKEPGYRKHFQNSSIDIQQFECACCHTPVEKVLPPVRSVTKSIVSISIDGYMQALRGVVESHRNNHPAATSTVTFVPLNMDIANVSPRILSNVDGYHPNVLGHQFLAKAYWNQLFLPYEKRLDSMEYDANLQVHCPSDSDRFQTM